MSAFYPRIRLSGPIIRSSWTPETGAVERIEQALLVRDVFRIVFFLPHDHFDLAPSVSHALDIYLDAVRGCSSALVDYICRGWQPFKWGEEGRQRIRATLNPKERTFFEEYPEHEAHAAEKEGASPHIIISGEQDSGYCFDYRARLPFRETPAGYVSVLRVTLPTELLEEQGPEAMRELTLSMTSQLPFASGHAGLALDVAPACSDCPPDLHEVMVRHPGFDLRHASIRDFMGDRVDGVHWLNFLGQPVLDKLGGIESLRARLRSPVLSIQGYGKGRALVALGSRPEAGELLRGQSLPAYRELARTLEPWLEPFDPGFLPCTAPGDGEEPRRRWWRRFLD